MTPSGSSTDAKTSVELHTAIHRKPATSAPLIGKSRPTQHPQPNHHRLPTSPLVCRDLHAPRPPMRALMIKNDDVAYESVEMTASCSTAVGDAARRMDLIRAHEAVPKSIPTL